MKIRSNLTGCLLLMLFFTCAAQAFKVSTHTWIGQQIINDLKDDGMLTFKVNGLIKNYPVNPAVRDAILNNPSAYRIGNIGPDAFPDMVTGLMKLHTGAEGPGRWPADKWAEHLLNNAKTPEEVAFVYGYFAHASADTWAHSYANWYSGDEYILFDGVEEEKRHFILENLIEKHNPPLLDANGQVVPWNQAYNVPAKFVRDTMIYNKSAAAENTKNGMKHLDAVVGLRDALISLDDELAEAEAYIAKTIADKAFGIKLSDDMAQEVADILVKIDKYLVDPANVAIDEIQKLNNRLVELKNAIQGKALEAGIDIVDINLTFQIKLLELTQKLDKFRAEDANMYALQLKLAGIDEKVCKVWVYHIWGSFCWTWKINPFWIQVNAALDAARSVRNTALKELTAAKESYIASLTELKDQIIGFNTDINRVMNDIIDLNQIILGKFGVLRAIRDNWIKDIDGSMEQYVRVFQEAMYLMITHSGKPSDPAFQWLKCSFPAVLGVPSPVVDAACTTTNRMGEINGAVGDLLGVVNQFNPLYKIYEKIKAKITTIIQAELDRVKRRLEQEVLGKQLVELIDLYDQNLTEAQMNEFYNTDRTSKNLLTFSDPNHPTRKNGDFVERIKAEMHVNNGQFDPENFPVMHNAITMVKLSLLGSDALHALTQDFGMPLPSIYGPRLYGYGKDSEVFTLIVNHGNIKQRIAQLEKIIADLQWQISHCTTLSCLFRRLSLQTRLNQAKTDLAAANTELNNIMAKLCSSHNICDEAQMQAVQLAGYDFPGNIFIKAIKSFDGNHQWMDLAPPYPRKLGPWTERKSFGYLFNAETGEGFRLFKDPQARLSVFLKLFKGPLAPGIEVPESMGFAPVLPADYPYKTCELNPFPVDINAPECP